MRSGELHEANFAVDRLGVLWRIWSRSAHCLHSTAQTGKGKEKNRQRTLSPSGNRLTFLTAANSPVLVDLASRTCPVRRLDLVQSVPPLRRSLRRKAKGRNEEKNPNAPLVPLPKLSPTRHSPSNLCSLLPSPCAPFAFAFAFRFVSASTTSIKGRASRKDWRVGGGWWNQWSGLERGSAEVWEGSLGGRWEAAEGL